MDYLELSVEVDPPVITQDAAGCRGVCEAANGGRGGGGSGGGAGTATAAAAAAAAADPGCTGYTWEASSGGCYLRHDGVWRPAAAAGFTSGRLWRATGDNPSPYIDPGTGAVSVMYRTDSHVTEKGRDDLASLIGLARAPHWSGPYRDGSAFGGPVSAPSYPEEENEDPFLFRNRRGEWHALLHACTWGDSRGAVYPVPQWAGRHAFSADGVVWEFSPTPAYGGAVPFGNGTLVNLARMERPVLLFDAETQAPTHLFNGVQTYGWDDFSWTLHQRVAVAGGAEK